MKNQLLAFFKKDAEDRFCSYSVLPHLAVTQSNSMDAACRGTR